MSDSNKPFQKGSTFLVVLLGAITVFFAAYAIFVPDDRYFALVFVMIGLVGTWRQFSAWQEKRK